MDPKARDGLSTEAQHAGVNADGTLTIAVPDIAGLPPDVARVAQALAGLGVGGVVRELPDPSPDDTTSATTQLGVEPGAIVRAYVYDADGSPLLVLASEVHRPDILVLAGNAGSLSVSPASPGLIRSATRQPIGGIAPVGHPTPLRTIVDVELSRHDVVWAAAGHPAYVFPTTYEELLRITAGEATEIGE